VGRLALGNAGVARLLFVWAMGRVRVSGPSFIPACEAEFKPWQTEDFGHFSFALNLTSLLFPLCVCLWGSDHTPKITF